MKKTGLVLFLALAAVFFMTPGQAAAQGGQLNYSENIAEGIVCEVFDGEVFCDVALIADKGQLLGTLVLTKAIVDDIINNPLDATIIVDIFNDDLLVGTTIDISPFNFIPLTGTNRCFANGSRTCVGTDDLGGTINMRATSRTIRFTYKAPFADIAAQLEVLPAPINAFLDAIVDVETFDFFLDVPQCFRLPTKGAISLRSVVARDGFDFELLRAFFRGQGRQGTCLDLIPVAQ
jgi:hypothetical protein